LNALDHLGAEMDQKPQDDARHDHGGEARLRPEVRRAIGHFLIADTSRLVIASARFQGVTTFANATTLQSVSPRTRPEPPSVKWDALAPETQATLNAGVDEAARGEFADLTPGETEQYLQTGELPERVERWLESYDSRPRT
jgi:hypothetical protein